MMRGWRSILFVVLVLALLTGPIGIYGAELLNVGLPSNVTANDARALEGGWREANIKANLSLKGFAEKKLQSAAETELGNRIPFKATAMLCNAASQRAVIRAANLPFGWDCYPTSLDSKYLFIPALDALTYMPEKRSEAQLDALTSVGSQLAEFARRHPDKRFVLYVVQGFHSPAENPAYELVADPATPALQVGAIESGLENAPSNVFLVTNGYGTPEEFYRDFFRTDHHWNWRGIARGYDSIASELGLQAVPVDGEDVVMGPDFSGSTARIALDLIAEPAVDSDADYSFLTVRTPDGRAFPYTHDNYTERPEYEKRYDFYVAYYDFLDEGTVIEGPGEGRALIIGNSYDGGILPLIAANYEETYLSHQAHPSKVDPNLTLENLLAESDADDVIFVANADNYQIMCRKCPEFFAEA